jgi:hypothetical protein
LRWVRHEPVRSWYLRQKAQRRGAAKPALVGVMRKLALKQAKISSPEGVQGASGAVRTLVAPLRAEQLGSSRD